MTDIKKQRFCASGVVADDIFTTLLFVCVQSPTEALALAGRLVHEHFGAEHLAKGHEHLDQLCIPEFQRQVVNKKVAAIRAQHGVV